MKRNFVSLVVCLAFIALLAVPAGISSVGTVEAGSSYKLTVNATNGSVTTDPDLEEYPPGTKVTLTAVPDPGYYFFGWSGAASGTTSPVTIIMNADKTVFAAFDTLRVDSITPNKLGNGSGNKKAQVRITGQGFLPNQTTWPYRTYMRVWIEKKYPNNKLIRYRGRYVVSDSNTIDCFLNVSHCIPGAWDVVVWKPTRPMPIKATLTGGLTVTPHPVITSIATDPTIVQIGNDNVFLTINGSEFQDGATVTLIRSYFLPPIHAIFKNDDEVTSGKITCHFNMKDWPAQSGGWRVYVTNPDGGLGAPVFVVRVYPPPV